MIKEFELDAPLDILRKVEATGLPCHWNGEVLQVTVDTDVPQDLIKLATALSGAKKVVYHCVKMDGMSMPDIETLRKAIEQSSITAKE
jgi:hypothetical protein